MMWLDIQIRQGSQWVSVNEEPDLFKGVESIQYDFDTKMLKIVSSPDTQYLRSLPESHILVNHHHPSALIVV